MKKAMFILSVFTIFVLTSCNNTNEKKEEITKVEAKSEAPDEGRNSKTSLDWAGT